MRSLRLYSDWPNTHPDIDIINAHGVVIPEGKWTHQMIQAGGKVIKGSHPYHKYNRYLLRCADQSADLLDNVDWYEWAWIGHYPNGRPTPELIVYEINKKHYDSKPKYITDPMTGLVY